MMPKFQCLLIKSVLFFLKLRKAENAKFIILHYTRTNKMAFFSIATLLRIELDIALT